MTIRGNDNAKTKGCLAFALASASGAEKKEVGAKGKEGLGGEPVRHNSRSWREQERERKGERQRKKKTEDRR